ncbi:MAG: MBL fold metallo-hydrolase [Clostridia bacterium]|nr:MBL fold metallo-hydrolase [Clostridia bacterium]
MELEFLGTGTSHGVPVIGCDCNVCKSTDSKNKRMRCSAYVKGNDDSRILIDCGPEFRIQALRSGINKVDAVLLTHSHADHLHGLDDLRIFSCALNHAPDSPTNKNCYAPPIPLYTNKNTIKDVQNRFDYIFGPAKQGGGHAKIDLIESLAPFTIGSTVVTPIPMLHGSLPTLGWMLSEGEGQHRHSIAYLTDLSFLSEKSIALINQFGGTLDHIVIDGLRIKKHDTHFNFLQALETASKIKAKHLWLTHFTHDLSHDQVTDYLNEHINDYEGLSGYDSIAPSYDGLKIKTE